MLPPEPKEEKVLYWNIGSQPGRAVKCLLDIGKIDDCKMVTIDLMTREQKSKEYLEKYPLGKIPFFTKGEDVKIGESNAIMTYLWETEPRIPRTFYGETPSQRAMVNQYMSWYQASFRQKMFKPVILFLGTILMNKPIFQNQKDQSIQEIHEALKELDTILQKNKTKYICGDHPTFADLLIYFEVTNVILFSIDYKEYKHLDDWFKNVYGISEVKQLTHQWFPMGKQTAEMFSQIEVIKSKL